MTSSGNAARKTDAREYSRAEKAAPRETSPPVFSTYGTRFGQIAFALLWLTALLAPYAFSGFAPATQDDFAPPAPFGPLTGQSLFCALTALAAFFAALIPRVRREYSRIEKVTIGALAVFFALTCASVLVASYRYEALLEAVRIGCVVAWFFLARAIMAALFEEPSGFEASSSEEETAPPRVLAARSGALLGAIALGAAWVAGLAIRDFLTSGSARQASTFYNNNLLANYCAMAAPLCLASAISALRRLRREYSPFSVALLIVAVATFFLTLGGLLITASKGGFLALLIALLVFTVALFGARRAALLGFIKARRVLVISVAAVVLLGGGALASKTVVPRLMAARTTDDNSTMFRAYVWRGALNMAREKPLLGWGAGAFPSTYSTRFGETGYTRSAHQSWLQIAAESGVPALLALFVSFGAACVAGARGLRGACFETAAGGMAALAALLAHGLVDSGWGITSIAFLAMIAMALLLSSAAASTRAAQSGARTAENDAAPNESKNEKTLPVASTRAEKSTRLKERTHGAQSEDAMTARADTMPRNTSTRIAQNDAIIAPTSNATHIAATPRASTRSEKTAALRAPENSAAKNTQRDNETTPRNQKMPRAASTREASGGNIRWGFMAMALVVAGAAWWMQRVVGAQDIVREDRARIAQNQRLEGGIDGALQRSAEAIAQNGGDALLHRHRAKLQEAANQDALSEYQTAAQLRANSADGWRILAQYLNRRGQTQKAAETFARAVALDPKNTALLWDFAQFQLAHGDARGYDNLRRIVALREAPYGRYPALGDFINLDFARAALLLAPRETDAKRRAALLQMAQRDLKAARAKQDYVVKFAASNYGLTDLEAPQDLDELEQKARVLAARKS